MTILLSIFILIGVIWLFVFSLLFSGITCNRCPRSSKGIQQTNKQTHKQTKKNNPKNAKKQREQQLTKPKWEIGKKKEEKHQTNDSVINLCSTRASNKKKQKKTPKNLQNTHTTPHPHRTAPHPTTQPLVHRELACPFLLFSTVLSTMQEEDRQRARTPSAVSVVSLPAIVDSHFVLTTTLPPSKHHPAANEPLATRDGACTGFPRLCSGATLDSSPSGIPSPAEPCRRHVDPPTTHEHKLFHAPTLYKKHLCSIRCSPFRPAQPDGVIVLLTVTSIVCVGSLTHTCTPRLVAP